MGGGGGKGAEGCGGGELDLVNFIYKESKSNKKIFLCVCGGGGGVGGAGG